MDKKSEFLARLKFRNTLPDIPFDPKLLQYPFDEKRFVRYTPTTLEQNHIHPLLTEKDMGIHLDLIDRDAYKLNPGGNTPLDPRDEALLQGTVPTAATQSGPGGPRKSIPRPAVSWLRRTAYLANDDVIHARGNPETYTRTRMAKVNKSRSTRDQVLDSIEETFVLTRKQPVHPTNPALVPVEVYPLFPDFALWPNLYTQVNFDSDPLGTGADDEMIHEGIIRGYKNNNMCSFLMPKKRRRDWTSDEKDIPYQQIRDYHFTMGKGNVSGSFFFRFDHASHQVVYNRLDSKISLTKKAKIGEAAEDYRRAPVTLHARDEPNEEEQEARQQRMTDLLEVRKRAPPEQDDFMLDSDSDEEYDVDPDA